MTQKKAMEDIANAIRRLLDRTNCLADDVLTIQTLLVDLNARLTKIEERKTWFQRLKAKIRAKAKP